ncbi:hypothetical protein DL93DRAFT_2077160 [Clavulina sp. PMI_390]|nr:hypothetical protein DL93DRAFT_2077160 [Clavulina sp. PMI_390]
MAHPSSPPADVWLRDAHHHHHRPMGKRTILRPSSHIVLASFAIGTCGPPSLDF